MAERCDPMTHGEEARPWWAVPNDTRRAAADEDATEDDAALEDDEEDEEDDGDEDDEDLDDVDDADDDAEVEDEPV